jgi:threonine dehydratase
MLECENLQRAGSFRSAVRTFGCQAVQVELAMGVVAASAGNHAQGVAWPRGCLA